MKNMMLTLALLLCAQVAFADNDTIALTFTQAGKPMTSNTLIVGEYVSVSPDANGQDIFNVQQVLGYQFSCESCADKYKERMTDGTLACTAVRDKSIQFYKVTEEIVKNGGGIVIVPEACSEWMSGARIYHDPE